MNENDSHTWDEGEALTLHSPLASLIRRRPVTVSMDMALGEALAEMDRQRVGSLIVIDPGTERVRGIFTLQDVLRRVALKGADMRAPISGVMSPGLITLRPQATGHEAAVTMSRRNVRHVVVTDHGGALVGLVSQNDLYAIQRAGVRELQADIRNAQDMATLVRVGQAIRRLGLTLIKRGMSAEQLSHFVTSLNDVLTLRVLELTEAQFRADDRLPSDVSWCWLALGSEGRLEQTFSTDQDNGLIIDCPAHEAEAQRARFLPFAQEVNQRLDSLGFPLCKGKVMAGNPSWCLSLDEWKACFGQWIHSPQPEALLNASIFFDFRALYGEASLADRLRDWLFGITSQATLFLRMMAENALRCTPPLGLIRDFRFDDSKAFPHTLDLKANGTRPFVDAARIYALRHALAPTSTSQRLRAAADTMSLGKEDVHAMIDAFFFIQSLRLRHQYDLAQAGQDEGANRIDPDRLNELDRTILKEAFRQARKLQQRLQLDYRIQ